jgi:hypothetical protein
MAYMNQEKKKVIKANLDAICKPLGIKYTLRVQNYSKICCTIKSAPIDFIGNYNDTMMASEAWKAMPDILKERDNVSVNPYWYQDHYTGEVKEVIGKLLEAMRSADYYDRSDAMTDYFDTAYYYGLSFGDYKVPFKYTGV